MTHERDIDRLLDLWLIDGPTQVADRVILEVADRVDRQPQRPAWRLFRRPTPMTSSVRWAAVLVAVALIAAVGFVVIGRRPSDSDISASPTPTSSAESSPAARIPDALRYRWAIDTRPVPGYTGDQFRSFLDLRNPRAWFDTGSDSILGSMVTSAASDQVTFTSMGYELADATLGCADGEAGTYTFALSAGGTFLTLTPAGADPCAARAAAFPGTWTRSEGAEGFTGAEANAGHIGDLEAATYKTTFFKPLGPAFSETIPGGRNDYGQMSYTVPAGWMNDNDDPESYSLRRQGSEGWNGIFMNTMSVISKSDSPCWDEADPSVPRTAIAMADALSARAGLVVTDRQPVTIGAYQGVRLDLAQAPGRTATCPTDPSAVFVPLFTDSDPGEGYTWQIGPTERMRLYLIDVGDQRVLLVDVNGEDEAKFQAILPEAIGIVESIQLRAPAP